MTDDAKSNASPPTDAPRPPGHPGLEPRWTSSAKSGAGTATSRESRVWFTLSHGILNEVYFPFIDQACTRDLGLLVGGPDGFFSEEKRDAETEIEPLAQGVPGYRITNTCREGRYQITKTVVADPKRDTVLQDVQFEALEGALSGYTVYALLAPHLGNHGAGNTGWQGDYKGHPMLFARRGDAALALASDAGFEAMSCGYGGTSDGWQDLAQNGRMDWHYERAEDGNVALTGAVDLAACDGHFVLALAFGEDAQQAGLCARASLLEDFGAVVENYVAGWQDVQDDCQGLIAPNRDAFDLYRTSVAVLHTHESKHFPGASVASLSIPWGFSKGDDNLGGYHLIWPRDLVETAMGFLAAGDTEAARKTLFYLQSTQEADGHWQQNMWLSGAAYWKGVQDDETALPILLADRLRREEALGTLDLWPMVRRAAGFLVRSGPVTQQERWEENAGFSVYTLATQIAALLAAAAFADQAGEEDLAQYLRETADTWNDRVEAWTYAEGTRWAREAGVDGHYVRIAPPDFMEGDALTDAAITLKNQPQEENTFPATEIVGPDALALVHFGLRAPDDERIRNTVAVIDAATKTETATGPVWHRYTHDGYGEHAGGAPFDGTGTGRGWPLLACERAFYELHAGNRDEAERLLRVVARQTSPGGLLPEQVWDAEDVPARELFSGKPAGSAMPLVWAHAECIKLVRALHDDALFDLPPQPVARYQEQDTTSPFVFWRFDYQVPRIAPGDTLRIEVEAPARLHWSADDWNTVQDTETNDPGLGLHHADLPTENLAPGTRLRFTFYWPEADRWEGTNFSVIVK